MLEVMYRDETRPVRNALSEPVVRPSIACGNRALDLVFGRLRLFVQF